MRDTQEKKNWRFLRAYLVLLSDCPRTAQPAHTARRADRATPQPTHEGKRRETKSEAKDTDTNTRTAPAPHDEGNPARKIRARTAILSLSARFRPDTGAAGPGQGTEPGRASAAHG